MGSAAVITGTFAIQPRESCYEILTPQRAKPCTTPLHKDTEDKLVNESCQFEQYLKFITAQEYLEVLQRIDERNLMEVFPKFTIVKQMLFKSIND